jgi:hypothetical protein
MLLFRKNPSPAKWMAITLAAAFTLLSACKPGGEGDDKGEKDDDCAKQESLVGSLFASSSKGKDDNKKDKGDKGDDKEKCPKPSPSPTPAPTPPPTTGEIPGLPGRSCTVDRFAQGSGDEVVKKVDILFVMDHSGSMADDWARVANNVQNLVKELPATLDIRYAVLLANASSQKGRLYAPVKIPVVLSNQTQSIREISNNLHKIFVEGMKVGDSTGSGEASFLSLHSAVTANARDNQKLGFFRADAALSILFMSDEQEIGFPFPNPQAPGLPNRCDAAFEDNIKKTQYDAKGINLDVAFNAVKAFKGDMPVVTHAFVNISKEDLFKRNSKNASCLYDSLGYGYFEMVEKTKGVLFSIQANKAEGMARCGRVIKERLSIIHEFPLSKPADQVDAATILAYVDGGAVPHEYRSAGNLVHLENAGVAESKIEIRHCSPITRQPWTLQAFAGQAGQYAAGLSWVTPEQATRGKILYGTSPNSLNWEMQGADSAVTEHSLTVERLTPNTVYYFQASSVDQYNEEKRSAVINLRTLPDWGITGLSGQPSRNNVNVSWRTPEYATKGKVLYGSASNALVNESAETVAANEHSVQISGLSSNTTYYFQPVSRDEYGLEKKGEVVVLKTLNEWGIVGFSGAAARNSVDLAWQTPEYATAGRVVWGSSAAALNNNMNSAIVGNNHSLTVNGLNANTTYYFQAVGLDDQGLQKRSAVIAVRTLVDWALTGFNGASTQNSVSVSWKTAEYATSGRVVWGNSAEALANSANSNGPSSEHSATINGLSPDTLFYFQAISSDEFGLTKASEVVAIRTQARPVDPPVKPEWEMTDFSGHADKTYVSIGWKTSAYATAGTVRWGISETNLNNVIEEGAYVRDHAVLVNGLTPDTLYYFQAVSIDDHGQVKTSAVTAVRTLADDPTPPPPVGNWEIVGFDSTTTPTSADVIWRTPGAATKATLKVGLAADNLNHRSVAIDTFADTHLVPVTGLSPDTVYYLQVIAVDSNGRTIESVVIMKRTKLQ